MDDKPLDIYKNLHICDHLFCSGNPCGSECGIKLLEQLNNLSKSTLPNNSIPFPYIETRPWGNYRVLFSDNKCKIKIITVDPGKRLSFQSHKNRDETWNILSGKYLVEIENWKLSNDKTYDTQYTVILNKNHIPTSCYIKRNEKHRISNIGTEPLIFIEIQTGDSFDEDDIQRFEDDFGRVNQKEMEK
jgi:mannose-6-phosphate isomerase-like protein (cupin superfamily)